MRYIFRNEYPAGSYPNRHEYVIKEVEIEANSVERASEIYNSILPEKDREEFGYIGCEDIAVFVEVL